MSTTYNSPFLDVRSFEEEATSERAEETLTRAVPSTPFLAVYHAEQEAFVDPQTEQYVAFLNELYDEQFNEVLSNLVDEARAVYEANFDSPQSDARAAAYPAQRLLDQHFAPLVNEAEAMIRAVASEISHRDPENLNEDQVETLVDSYRPSTEINPQFEEWLGSLLKRVVNKGLDLAKSAASTLAKYGLAPILNKLLAFVQPMVKHVVDLAISKLPVDLQPIAKLLRDKVPWLKEFEEGEATEPETGGITEVAEIQHDFNQHVANLLFAETEAEQELEIARVTNPPDGAETFPAAELDTARERLVDRLAQLRDGEDPSPEIENFIPALLPALKIGIKIAGRKNVVNYLANFLARVIQRFIGPQYAPPLSRAIVDAGLGLLHLEAPEREQSRASSSAVASTIEDTVRRVAALPEYVLDNQELLEGATLEAFEQAAANNLPAVLSEETYRDRPELREHRRGFWYRCGRRYKKRLGPSFTIRISPYRLASLETFGGSTVGEALEEQYAMAPGEEVEAEVHLYEALPGMQLGDIARGEEPIRSTNGEEGQNQLHPLTREAAALLLDQPELGVDVGSSEIGDPTAPQVGQRFYYLDIPGKRPLMVPLPGRKSHVRHRSRSHIVFHFPKNEIVARLYLSEIRSQQIAVKLRQHAHMGTVAERLRRFIERGVNRAFARNLGINIVHGAVVPGQSMAAFNRLPALVPQVLRGRITEWLVKAVAEHLQKHAQEFIAAADNPADGVTLVIVLHNPPGFRELGEALKARGVSLTTLRLPPGEPTVALRVRPGHHKHA